MTRKVIMISGANRGIGKAIADRLAEQNYQLSIGVRDVSTVTRADSLVCPYDATEPSSAENWVNKTLETYGQIDGLINNAGIVKKVPFQSYSSEDESAIEEMWKINSLGPLLLSKLCAPHLYRSATGRIIHIASMSGKRVGSRDKNMGYAMSKFSLMAASQAISLEGAGDIEGVRSTVICPGFVKVERTEKIIAERNIHTLEPDDIARTVAFLLELPKRVVLPEISIVPCSQI